MIKYWNQNWNCNSKNWGIPNFLFLGVMSGEVDGQTICEVFTTHLYRADWTVVLEQGFQMVLKFLVCILNYTDNKDIWHTFGLKQEMQIHVKAHTLPCTVNTVRNWIIQMATFPLKLVLRAINFQKTPLISTTKLLVGNWSNKKFCNFLLFCKFETQIYRLYHKLSSPLLSVPLSIYSRSSPGNSHRYNKYDTNFTIFILVILLRHTSILCLRT